MIIIIHFLEHLYYLIGRQGYSHNLLLGLVSLFSYYYATSTFATMNAGVGLFADDTASSLDSDDLCGSGTCGLARIAIIDPTFTAKYRG